MKFAYTSLACPEWTIEEAVEAAVHYGYDAIEWRLADGETIEPHTPVSVLRRLRAVPEAKGIEVACLDTSCRVTQPTAAARDALLVEGMRMLDIAAELRTRFVRVFGGPLPADQTRAALLEPTAEVLRKLGLHAEERGIVILLETHDSWTNSTDILALLQATRSPAAKVLWDVHHTYRSGEAPEQSVGQLGDALAYVHIKDGRELTGAADGWELCLLNEGTVPLRETCTALKRSGYDAYLSLEWEKKWHPELAEPEIALPQAIAWLRRYWQEA